MEEPVKILVVDDDEVDRMAVRRALVTAGVKMDLSEANGCAEAIAQLQQQQFDCVFLDYRLPDGDGLSLVQQIRSLGFTVPLVVLTGQGDEQIAVQLMKAGAYDYLSKSKLSVEGLSQTLRNAIRLHKVEMAAQEANNKLRESEERYRLVLEAANDGVWDWYCTTDEVYCNDRLLEIIGVERAEFTHTPTALLDLIHPEDLPEIKTVVKNHLLHGQKCEAEFRILHSSGEYRHCVARGKAQRDSQGCPYRMSGIVSDITESRRLDAALKASESRFQRLAETNIVGVILTKLSGEILEANQAFLQMVGYTQQDLKAGKLHWQKMTPPEYAEQNRLVIEQLRTAGSFNYYEKEYIRKDGTRVPVLLGAAVVEQLPDTAICFTVDLSDRKRSEAEIINLNRNLARRVNELETLLDVIPLGIAIAQDPKCQYIRVNTAMAKLMGLSSTANASKSAPLEERPTYKVFRQSQEIPASELPMQQAASSGRPVLDVELDLVIKEGTPPVKLLGNAAPLFDEQGQCRGSIGAFVDITERKRIEEQERFLVEASNILAASLDYQTILHNLAQSIVPQLADWCSIHILEADGSIRQVSVAHSALSQVRWLEALACHYPVSPNSTLGVAQVIHTGESVLYPEIDDRLLQNLARDRAHLQSLRQIQMKSALCVPIQARGRTLGAISFVAAESQRVYTHADLIFAEDLGRRAGLAVDNGRLYQEANEIGENLRQAIVILGEQQQQLRVLQRIGNLLNQRLTDVSELLHVIVGAVCDGIPDADFAAIATYNSATDELETSATAGIGKERLLLTEIFDPDLGVLRQVFETGEAQLIRGSREQGRAGSREGGQGGQGEFNSEFGIPNSEFSLAPSSLYAVPIASVNGERLGVLVVGNWQNLDAFDPEDQNLMAAVGEQAAIAIGNARLIQALEEREERLAAQNLTLAQQNRELELTRQRIEQQNLQLIEAARLKSQFLATMSHELRTPLNAVIGFAQVLLRQRSAALSGTQSGMIDRILSNGKHLLALINDILDLSKIESGRLELQLELISLDRLVLSTIDELRPLAEQKQLPIHVDLQTENVTIVNDSNRLRQILVNLLSNAIKFTESGCIEIKTCELSNTQFRLSVKDTGIGIAASELDHIFEEFRQVDQTTTRKHGGTGLGLAITKSLVHMMQGKISVESQLGKGSTFNVELPKTVTGE
ncbi:PAS domain S-box protein [Chroococcidiopsis sp. FACHB-1243]|uniref:PAS domain S-box protein n=1 Tax=Chroococcidiopsis sp. [FACHB-1243] TaxID=2692781 RepID=UPI00177ECE9A|nr:PAS domain S-box protein [Chroococcidiopsis sp. [FACHB-1243]]MBD2305163.1 PAS domain S-box protein [Chroococcidiopsis sp. [FACHB-1243]]